MTLPPVVSDVYECPPRRRAQTVGRTSGYRAPHVWESEGPLLWTDYQIIEICRYCGGRRP